MKMLGTFLRAVSNVTSTFCLPNSSFLLAPAFAARYSGGVPVCPGTGKLSRGRGFQRLQPVLETLDFAIGAIRKWQSLTHGPEDRVTMEFMVEIHASERSRQKAKRWVKFFARADHTPENPAASSRPESLEIEQLR
jgi:hypothetical protein